MPGPEKRRELLILAMNTKTQPAQPENKSMNTNAKIDQIPSGTFHGEDSIPPGTFHGEDSIPPGTFHGEDSIPPGTFH